MVLIPWRVAGAVGGRGGRGRGVGDLFVLRALCKLDGTEVEDDGESSYQSFAE